MTKRYICHRDGNHTIGFMKCSVSEPVLVDGDDFKRLLEEFSEVAKTHLSRNDRSALTRMIAAVLADPDKYLPGNK